ncbi:DUF2142 domain-containing protein [Raoultibacter massiliensis]|uniref:DUF2142 domain-containing protein n=1 Tax=Raoultibacter massiliensis TaxID=1852371 RepID=UPI003A8D3E03
MDFPEVGMRNDRLKNGILFSLYFLCIVVGEAGLLASICFHYGAGWFTFDTALAVVFLAFAIVLFFMLWGRACRKDQTLFVLVAAPLLVGFALFMMPFAVPDEFTHINRVFDNRSTCPLTTPAQLLDAYTWIGSYDVLGGFMSADFDYSLTKETEYCAASYSTVNYLPPALVVAVGKFFGINGYVLIFAARLSNAALYLVACYWMIGKLPFGRKFAFVFLLNPMLLQQEASCSVDALCNIAIFGFVVQLIAMRFDERSSLPVREWVVLAAFIALVTVCKYAYLPLVLSSVVLYPKIKTRAVRIAVPIAASVLAAGALAFISLRYGTLVAKAAQAICSDSFLGVLGATVFEEGMTVVWQFSGGNLGWPYMNHAGTIVSVYVPVCWIVFLVALGLSVLASFDERIRFKRWERAGLVALGLLESLLLYIALGEGFSGPGPITWLQGRYFIPPVFLMLFALMLTRKTPFEKIPMKAFAVVMLAINVVSLMFVIRWFW